MKSFEHEVKYVFYTPQISHLEGELLTLVEAITPDVEQRRSVKNLIRRTVWDWAIGNNQIPTTDEHNRVKK